MPGSNNFVSTACGTRPGDPLADAAFALMLHGALLEIEHGVRELGLAAPLQLGAIHPIQTREAAPFVSTAWHDDIAIGICATSSSTLLEACRSVTRVVVEVFRSRGMTLSFEAGKTEWVVSPLGAGAKDLKAHILQGDSFQVAAFPDVGPCVAVRLVQQYKHLGSIVCDSASLIPDIRRRIGEAYAAAKELRRQVYANPALSLKARRILFRSLVLSRLTHNVGAWAGLSKAEALAWQGGVLRIFKCLLTGAQAKHDAHVSQTDICELVGLPSPAHLLALERLRLLGQLCRCHCAPTLALLEAGIGARRCWLTDVCSDLRWAAGLLPRHLPASWRTDLSIDIVFEWIQAAPRLYGRIHAKLWAKAAVLPGASRGLISQEPAASQLAPCPLCSFRAKNRTGLAAHLAHAHGLRSVTRRLAASSTCPSCLINFHTRTRVLQHLRRHSPCFQALRHGGWGLPESVAEELDKQELARWKVTRGRGRADSRPCAGDSVATTGFSCELTTDPFFLEDFLA